MVTNYNHDVPTRLLAETINQEIAPAEFELGYDVGSFYTNEIWLPRQDIEAGLKAADGTRYVCKTLVYPGGFFNDTVVTQALAAGYLGGRADETSPLYTHMEKLDLFHFCVPGGTMYGYILMLRFEHNSLDTSPEINDFIAVNPSYSTQSYRQSYAADFNGTNAYFHRAANPDFDFSRGDWHFSARINPRNSATPGTLFCSTNAVGRGLRILVGPDLSVILSISSGSAEILHLNTPPGILLKSQYQKVSVQELFDQWFIRINDVTVAATTNYLRLSPLTGELFIGCDINATSGQPQNFLNALLDDVVMSNGTFYKTQGMLDMMSAFGGVMFGITHGESGMPREILRIYLDAITNYSGRLKVMTYGEAINYLLAKGSLLPDNRTLIRTDLGHSRDCHLRPDSPCLRKGDPTAVQGTPNLFDLDGGRITDDLGNVVIPGGRIDMGAFVNRNAGYPAPVLKIDPPTNIPPQLRLIGMPGLHYQVDVSGDLLQWITLTDFVSSVPETPVSDPAAAGSARRFYRALIWGN
jgi:hypothetical protein